MTEAEQIVELNKKVKQLTHICRRAREALHTLSNWQISHREDGHLMCEASAGALDKLDEYLKKAGVKV